MSKLAALSLNGFQSIKRLELEFKDINILIGANGAGKSNLIRFFSMLNCMLTGGLRSFTIKNGGASSLLHYGPKVTPEISAQLFFESQTGLNSYSVVLQHAANDTLFYSHEEIAYKSYGLEDRMPFQKKFDGGHTESIFCDIEDLGGATKTTAHFIQKAMSMWRVFHFHDTSPESRIKQANSIHDNIYLRHNAGNLASFLYAMQNSQPQFYKRIVRTIQMVAPFFHDFVLAPEGESIILRWEPKGADTIFGPHQISDGTLRFMALATLLLQPSLPETIVIDEPELGLHPYALLLLSDLVKKASTQSQILIATQSEPLLDHFDTDNIIVVDHRSGCSEFKRLHAEDLSHWREEYTVSQQWSMNVFGGRPGL